MSTQRAAPVLKALAAMSRQNLAAFGAPGHGGGQAATSDVLRLIGRRAFSADLLTPKGLDDRTESLQALQKAHALAAKAWNADLCRFSTGGSTQSLHTAMASVAQPGDTILIGQNAHKAAFAAAIFAGLNLVTVPVTIDRDWDIEHGMSPSVLGAMLDAHPAAKAVIVVSPSYFGVTSDIAALARICHAKGVPLIVDAAWGAAFGFNDRLPVNPLRAGADIVVVSIHKTMAALGQGSAIFVSGDRVDQERFALAYELFQTTSPSVAVFASLDATRREHALHGRRIWDRVLGLAAKARASLAQIEGVRVMGRERLDGNGGFDLDETKITLDVSGLGVSGYDADDWLASHHGVSVGLSDQRHLLAIFSAGVTARKAARLTAGVRALADHIARHPRAFRPPPPAPPLGELTSQMAMPASKAFFAQTELVSYERAARRIAAEIIAPAPPGVPRLIPGQIITPTHVAFLLANRDAGFFLLDPADPDQRKIRVVK